jgi:hypothetical protein
MGNDWEERLAYGLDKDSWKRSGRPRNESKFCGAAATCLGKRQGSAFGMFFQDLARRFYVSKLELPCE